MKIDVTGKHFFGVLTVLGNDPYCFKLDFSLLEITRALILLKFLDVEFVNLDILTNQIRESLPHFTGWYIPEKEEYLSVIRMADFKLKDIVNKSFTDEFYSDINKVIHYLKGVAEDITEIKLETILTAMSLEPELNIYVLLTYVQIYPIWRHEIQDHYTKLIDC